MTRLEYVNELHAAAALIASPAASVELVSVADDAGAMLDAAVRQLWMAVHEDDPDQWNELLTAARQLRWRRATEPCPPRYSPRREELVGALVALARRRKLVANEPTGQILDDLAEQVAAVGHAEHPAAAVLLESVEEVGAHECAVILVDGRAVEGVRSWFHDLGLEVAVAGGRAFARLDVKEQAYLFGTPGLFGNPVLTAPRAHSLAYIFPSWAPDKVLRASDFSSLARGGIRPRPMVHEVGERQPILDAPGTVDDQLVPAPIWVRPVGDPADAGDDEVVARRVLLAGGRSIWLDQDGGWIRTLELFAPPGERVQMRDERTINPGTFLVLREGETESEALYARALALLGSLADGVDRAQQQWKRVLQSRLAADGRAASINQLKALGVRAFRRAPSWTARTVARPQNDSDFVLLLNWLHLPADPFVAHANQLRKARFRAAADVREALENALDRTDVERLECDGHVRLDLDLDGFAAIIAARVLAVSPYEEVVPRHAVRIPVADRGAQWLE